MSLDITKLAAGLVLALGLSCSTYAQDAAAPAAAATSGPQYADRAEYDLVQQFQKETDPAKQIDLLKQWKDKYPNSAFKEQRYNFMVVTYQKAGNAQGMYDTAKEMAAANPKGFGNYWLTILTTSMAKTDDAFLSTGEQAANGLLTASEDSTSGLPADQKTNFQAAAHKTLGWVAMQRKNYPTTEAEFGKVLAITPNDAETSYFLGQSMLLEKDTTKIPAALFIIAHAAGVTGQGALPAATNGQVQEYLKKAYASWHGPDPAGYAKLLADAKGSATPPAGFDIPSKAKIQAAAIQAENDAMAKDPALAQWKGLRGMLSAPDGATKFASDIKEAEIPTKFTGKVVSSDAKSISVGVEDPATADATLVFPTALKCKVEPGTALTFSGAPEAFTATPYMLTMKVTAKNVTGLPAGCTGPAAAPVRRAPVRRK